LRIVAVIDDNKVLITETGAGKEGLQHPSFGPLPFAMFALATFL
jgi:hypothetical protein